MCLAWSRAFHFSSDLLVKLWGVSMAYSSSFRPQILPQKECQAVLWFPFQAPHFSQRIPVLFILWNSRGWESTCSLKFQRPYMWIHVAQESGHAKRQHIPEQCKPTCWQTCTLHSRIGVATTVLNRSHRWTDALSILALAYWRATTTCHSLVPTMLKVQTSPSLILFSWQNLFQPDPPRWLQYLYGTTRACQDVVLLIEVLRVIVQGSLSPSASQKANGKDCMNCNRFVSQMVSVSQCPGLMYRYNSGWIMNNDCKTWIFVHVGFDNTFRCSCSAYICQMPYKHWDYIKTSISIYRFVSSCDTMHTHIIGNWSIKGSLWGKSHKMPYPSKISVHVSSK
jgi:hypothetical protein